MNSKMMNFLLRIIFSPFTIWVLIFKTKKLKMKNKAIVLTVYSLLLIGVTFASKDNQIITKEESADAEVASNIGSDLQGTSNMIKVSGFSTSQKSEIFEGYTLIEVPGGDLSGSRQSNVVVDIGYGDRIYWAFTNEHGQLIKVVADEIFLQNDATEDVTSEGRYYHDEAKVPGTEASNLDEGHVIADSLGGVSNAYNITPQDSTLNRHGDQAYMESVIRDAGGCTNFVATIRYSDIYTQIPTHYSFTYTIKGNIIHDEFDNVNPDELNK